MMILITILTAIISLVIVLLIFSRLIELNKVHKAYYDTSEGLNDRLLYNTIIEDGIIALKNGSLLSVWRYTGADNTDATAEKLEFISSSINRSLLKLGSGFMLHVDSVRESAPSYIDSGLSFFPNKLLRLFDEERRQFFKQNSTYITAHYMALTYRPPLKMQQKFVDLMYTTVKDVKEDEYTAADKVLNYFKTVISDIESNLYSVLNFERLKAVERDGVLYDTLLEYLNYSITGESHPIRLPETPVHIDLLIGGQDVINGTIPKIGDHYVMVLSIEGFPAESYPDILSALSDMNITYRFTSRAIFLDQQEALARATKLQKFWKQKEYGIVDVILKNYKEDNIDHDARAMKEDATLAITLIKGGQTNFILYTATCMLADKDINKLKDNAEYVKKVFNFLGFDTRIETINCFESYLGSLAGHSCNIRKYLISTMNYADLLPTSTVYSGSYYSPNPFLPDKSPYLLQALCSGNTPYYFNFHVSDVGHGMIFGPVGTGKSTLLLTMATQFLRYRNATVHIFDRNKSAYAMCRALGGSFYEIGAESCKLTLNPMSLIKNHEGRSWLLEWLEDIFCLNKVFISVEQRKLIADALERMYKNLDTSPDVSLTNLIAELQDAQLRTVLEQYSMIGPKGNILDNTHDDLEFSFFNVYELEKLLEMGAIWYIPILTYIFKRIELSLIGSPNAIFIDEITTLLKFDIFKKIYKEILLLWRKKNAAVWAAGQVISAMFEKDANGSCLADIVLENTASKIFLPNASALTDESAKYYQQFGLNKKQINTIATAQPKREYYHVTKNGSRLIDLALSDIFLAFNISDPASIKELEIIADSNDNWIVPYLSSKGITLTNY